MQGAPRRQAHSWARSFFLLPSVLALLALAVFPVIAHAESSAGATYETEVPSVESEPQVGGSSATHGNSSNNQQAHGSAAEAGNGATRSGAEGKSGDHKSGEGSSQEEDGNPPTAGGGGGGSSNGGGSEGSVGPAHEVGQTSGSPASQSTGGSGSSPVVPILIAVVVLAAISIGVVLYRQRKGGSGSDGRVSSSNAG